VTDTHRHMTTVYTALSPLGKLAKRAIYFSPLGKVDGRAIYFTDVFSLFFIFFNFFLVVAPGATLAQKPMVRSSPKFQDW